MQRTGPIMIIEDDMDDQELLQTISIVMEYWLGSYTPGYYNKKLNDNF